MLKVGIKEARGRTASREVHAVVAGAVEEVAEEAENQESPGMTVEVWPHCEIIICIARNGRRKADTTWPKSMAFGSAKRALKVIMNGKTDLVMV